MLKCHVTDLTPKDVLPASTIYGDASRVALAVTGIHKLSQAFTVVKRSLEGAELRPWGVLLTLGRCL